MPNNIVNIFEDQENRIPLNRNAIKRDVPNRRNKLAQRTTNATANNDQKRTVLGNLSVANTSNIVGQNNRPTRSSKVNKQTKLQIAETSDSNCSASNENRSNRQNTTTLSTASAPSFSILSDSSETSSTVANKSDVAVKKSSRIAAKKKEQEKALLKLPENVPKVSNFTRHSSVSSTSSVTDMSICEDDCSMVVESPSTLPTVTTEDILATRDKELFDSVEYKVEIYKYLREAEQVHKPRANYMLKQSNITYGMRWILIDWLVEVSEEYNLHTETLHLAISYTDRFLSQMAVTKDKLQLVGTTAIFVAAKFEEIYPPEVTQLAYITNNTYTIQQILRMEHLILKVLGFDMNVPTPYLFVCNFAKTNKSTKETTNFAHFLADLSLLDGDPFLRYLPSQIGAAALALANYNQGLPSWSQTMVRETKYSLVDLKECYINLNRAFSLVKDFDSHAIRDKYKTSEYNYVSLKTPRSGYPWESGIV